MDNIVTELLDLPNTNVTDYKIINDTVYIYIESTESKIPCRECGKETTPNGFAREIKLRHLPMMGKPCYLMIKPKRGTCSTCGGAPTTNQRVDWYEYKSRYTKAFENYMLLSLVNSTVSDVAIKNNIGPDAIDGILQRRIDSKVNWNEFSKIGLLGIDEISLKKGHRDFVTLVTSRVDNKTRIIAVIKGREKSKIKVFLSSIPNYLIKTVVGVCTDMYVGYVNAAKEIFNGRVSIIVDRFHVAKLYRKCLVSLRKGELARIKKELTKEECQSLKSAIAILVTGKEYATKKEKKILQPLFKLSPSLKVAYKLCCQLTGIYNSYIGKCKASNKIDEWINRVEKSGLKCFNKFVSTLRKFKPEIIGFSANSVGIETL